MAEVATIGATQRRAAGGTSPVLEVRELRTHFFTDEGDRKSTRLNSSHT